MGPFELFNHLLNFAAPALWLAVWVTLLAHVFMRKRPVALSIAAQVAINFAVAGGALVVGLLCFGRDGKMLTYLGMALLCAASQWVMLRGWRN